MDNEVIGMLISIYMVVWTFSTSLLLFFWNNREKKICGISYEKVFKVHMKTINFLKAALCLPIFEVIICVWKKNANVLVGLTMVQAMIAVMLIWMINRIIQLSAVKKTVHKQLKKKMIYLYDSKNLQIKSAQIVGPTGSIVRGQRIEEQTKDPIIPPVNNQWPSDHKGVLITFYIKE